MVTKKMLDYKIDRLEQQLNRLENMIDGDRQLIRDLQMQIAYQKETISNLIERSTKNGKKQQNP